MTTKEKILLLEPRHLTDTELLSLLLVGSGNTIEDSTEILKRCGNLANFLSLSIPQMISFKGVGISTALLCKSLLEICTRIHSDTRVTKITTARDVFNCVKSTLYGKSREHLLLLSLGSRNNLLGCDLISIGTVDETLIHPREIFKTAILRSASTIILCHNHPSGDCTPSSEDIQITHDIAELACVFGIGFIDHVIVSNTNYFSFRANNVIKRKEVSA
ncbi:MAG: DNA repair protein RadC [Patescibacteria group bacterium]|uniref:DNA repair protein RadC n=1 Tax=candidate division WWE3 bacterium TaxID=2053526 RepID=A0A955EC33_UNCKA|nr:DNA repair protein RadC [candidate division WWE3 bacterium]